MANLKENILKVKYLDGNIADVIFNGITYHNVVVDNAIKELSSEETTELKLLLTDKECDGSYHLRIVEDYI